MSDDATSGAGPDPSGPQATASGLLGGAATGDTAKSGGLGGIIGAILKGLQPAKRRVTKRRRRRTTRSSTSSTGGWLRRVTRRPASGSSAGPLLSLHYHDAGGDHWATTRVAYGRRGDRIAVISSSDAQWWRHIRTGSPVQVRVRNAWLDGRARLVSRDDPTYTKAVGIFVEDRSQAAARRLGVAMDDAGRLDHGARRPGDAVVVWIEVDAG